MTFLIILGILFAVIIFIVLLTILLLPWMDRWGTPMDELPAVLPGDDLLINPPRTTNRSVVIDAASEKIFPWLVQMSADKSGLYSYTWLETLIQCPQTNADRIHEEWQDLKVGDKVLMCPDENMPPAYIVAMIEENHAIVMGHKENDDWVEIWQFNLVPQDDGTTRLVIRSRSAAEGWFWDIIRPGEFIMMRRMMLTIKEQAEGMAAR